MRNIVLVLMLFASSLAYGQNDFIRSDKQDAIQVPYDNTNSGLMSDDVQGALDELSVKECIDTVTVSAHGILTPALESVYLDIVSGDAVYGLGVGGDTIPSLGSVIGVIDANTLVVQRCGFSDDVFGLAPGYYYNGLTAPSTTVGSCAVPAFIVSNDAIYFNHNNAYCGSGGSIASADNGLSIQPDSDVSLGYEIGQASTESVLDYETGIDLNTNSLAIVGDGGEVSSVARFLPDGKVRFSRYERTSNFPILEWTPDTKSLFGGQATLSEITQHQSGVSNFGWGNRAHAKGGNYNFVMGVRAIANTGSDYNHIVANIANISGDNNLAIGQSLTMFGTRNIIVGTSINNTGLNASQNVNNIITQTVGDINDSRYNIVASLNGNLDANEFNLGSFGMSDYSDLTDPARGTYTNVSRSILNTTTSFSEGILNTTKSIIIGERMKIDGANKSFILGDHIDNTAENVTILMPFSPSVSGNLSTHDFKFTNTTPDKFFAAYDNGYDLYTSHTLAINGAASFPTGVSVAPGGTAWASISARKFKENGDVVDYESIYDKFKDVEIFEGWNYIGQDDKHIGVMADDFYDLVSDEVGNQHNDEKIETIDADGVQMALIKALQNEIEGLKRELEELKNK